MIVYNSACMCVLVPIGSGAHKIIDKIFVNTRYFVMKSNNYDNVDIAKTKVKILSKNLQYINK